MAIRESEFIYSIAEYLALERESEERHEYVDGYIYAMAGESPEHGEICANLSWVIGSQLSGTDCRARIKDTKVRSGPKPKSSRSRKGMYSYPDLLVVCGELRFHDEHADVLTNPTVIIEVLSDSTEKFDHGEKFFRYITWNPTLTDYLLVSQKEPLIWHYVRQPDGNWLCKFYFGRDQALTIESIGCQLPLNKVYERVSFPAEEAEEAEENMEEDNEEKQS
ncbi:MAG: Uma2 family endonuclease [Blastocatellia bacterium]|nr:Uma2 family endonuclease [Blastocatellia bacterium]